MNPTEEPSPEAEPPQLPEPDYGNYRTGKIGRLPKTMRDKLNLMLLDGIAHAEIPPRLGEAAKDITTNNVDKWATGGYKLWLAEFNHLQETRVQQEVAMDLAYPEGGSRIHEATLQLSATAITKMVRKLDLSDFEEVLRSDPAKLIPFLNSMATISNAEIHCERHRLHLQDREAAAQNKSAQDKPPGLTPETRRTIEKDLHLT